MFLQSVEDLVDLPSTFKDEFCPQPDEDILERVKNEKAEKSKATRERKHRQPRLKDPAAKHGQHHHQKCQRLK
jgi:hypothetical protein